MKRTVLSIFMSVLLVTAAWAQGSLPEEEELQMMPTRDQQMMEEEEEMQMEPLRGDGIGPQTMDFEEEEMQMEPLRKDGVGTQTMEEEEEMQAIPLRGDQMMEEEEEMQAIPLRDDQMMEEEEMQMVPIQPGMEQGGDVTAIPKQPGRIKSGVAGEQMIEWEEEEPQTVPALDGSSKMPGQMEGAPMPGTLSEQEMIEKEIVERNKQAAQMGDKGTASQDQQSAQKFQMPAGASLIAHFPLDGSANNLAGEPGVVVPLDGAPQVVAGKFGQAYQFKEKAVIAAPLDIDFETHPKLTITAWVKMPEDRSSAGGFIVSPGPSSDAPALRLSHNRIRGHSAGSKPVLYEDIPADTWTFVAGVWDFTDHTLRLQRGEAAEVFTKEKMDITTLRESGNHQAELSPPDEPDAEPKRYIFIGAMDFAGTQVASDVAIDDVRIYAGALSKEDVIRLSQAVPPSAGGENASTPRERVGQIVRDSGLADSEIVRQEQERRRQREAVLEGIKGSPETGSGGDTGDDNGDDSEDTTDDVTVDDTEDDTEEGWHFDSDRYRLTSISGKSGDIKKPIELEDGEGIEKIITYERSDTPCRVSIIGKTEESGVNQCGNDGNSAIWAEIDPAVIGGVMLCTNRINGLAKGLELRGHEINADGSLGAYHQDTDKLNNCLGNWQERVLCSTGYLATGIVAHFKAGQWGGRDALIGLQLICRRIISE